MRSRNSAQPSGVGWERRPVPEETAITPTNWRTKMQVTNIYDESGNPYFASSLREALRIIKRVGWSESDCEVFSEAAWRNLPDGVYVPPCEILASGLRVFRYIYDSDRWCENRGWRA